MAIYGIRSPRDAWILDWSNGRRNVLQEVMRAEDLKNTHTNS
jgi:hypothetical protein